MRGHGDSAHIGWEPVVNTSTDVSPTLIASVKGRKGMLYRFFRGVVLLLDAVVVVAFLVGYLARYSHPMYTWWAELVATGLPFLSLAVVGATLLVGLVRWWKFFAVHTLLVLLIVIRFASLERGTIPDATDLTLLTYNTSGGQGARAHEQGRAVMALVRAENPDLVAFQEAFVQYHPPGPVVHPEERLRTLIDTLGYRTIGPSSAQERTYTSLPVLGRVELIAQTRTIIEQNTRGRPKSQVIRTHFRWQGREAVHYNLHLHSFGGDKPWHEAQRNLLSLAFWKTYLRQYRAAYLVRAREVDTIRALLNQEHLPLIVSGDFNSTPHNSAFYRLQGELQDAFLVAGRGWGATYHVRLPLVRIDHVLVSAAWKAVAAHVSTTPYSDHRSLTVRLRWRND